MRNIKKIIVTILIIVTMIGNNIILAAGTNATSKTYVVGLDART